MCSEEFWKGDVSLESLHMALDGGADPAGKTHSGLSPLHWATLYKVDPDIIEILLRHGADASAEDDDGMPVLIYGLANGNSPKVIERLLESGANPNFKHESGLPLLHELVALAAFASHSGYKGLLSGARAEIAANAIEIIELLLKHGADAEVRDDYGQPVLFFYFRTLVEVRSFSVDPLLVSLLLDQGATVATENEYDAHILEYAMWAGAKTETVRLLMESGADAKQITESGENLLHAASRFGSEVGVFGLLLDAGVDVNGSDNIGATPLHLAAAHSGPEVVELLLQRGANIAALDNVLNTPLHSAMTVGLIPEMAAGLIPTKIGANPEVVRLLLQSGAAIDARTAKGETPLILAASHQIPKEFAFLSPRSADDPVLSVADATPIRPDVDADPAATLSLLLEHGADVNSVDEMHRTPLHWAAGTSAALDSADAVAFLLESRASVNPEDLAGDTPLHLVAKESRSWPESSAVESAVNLLLAHGADFTAINHDGDTACDLAQGTDERTRELFCHREAISGQDGLEGK